MSSTPYKEVKAWALRVRKAGINEYKSGFRTKDDARRWAMALELGVAWTAPSPTHFRPPGPRPQQRRRQPPCPPRRHHSPAKARSTGWPPT
ncbi:MAG: hypothetical protein K0B16_10665 [Burkholderiaceae bacterium]|nr:hypothetical protein [Burkholderiaceae bacterium]